MRRKTAKLLIGSLLTLVNATSYVLRSVVKPRPLRPGAPRDILLTGAFHSANWLESHLRPLAASATCGRLRVVSTFPIAPMAGLQVIAPSARLRSCFGDTAARLMTFIMEGLRRPADCVGGFHLLMNGIVSQLLAQCIGARSLYFCVGGPAEVLGGGINAENRLFRWLRTPWQPADDALMKIVKRFDMIVTMGSSAKRFFESRGVGCQIHIVPGGIDDQLYRRSFVPPVYDLVFVGRLVPIKRPDLLIDCIAIAAAQVPGLRAVLVGDGPLRSELQNRVDELSLQDVVEFAGQRSDIAAWLKQSRIFILTSDSEGLSLALMEAMMCGLPAVVSDVGDLGDLVDTERNGFLVRDQTGQAFAACVLKLLKDTQLYSRLSAQAEQDASQHRVVECTARWDSVLPQL